MSTRSAPPTRRQRSIRLMPLSSNGVWSRLPSAANWCGCSAKSCAPTSRPSAGSSRSRSARSPSEGLGEVQEMIDICDFAVGLSRQLYGLTIATERSEHRMMETWHPLGVTGIISAFNFPVAVWSWNAALALVCGNSIVWKPSEKTPLTALATQALFERALRRFKADGGRARRACPPCCSVGARSARSSSTTPGFRWSRRPARPPWDAPSVRSSRSASPAPFWSSAATTRRSSRRRPIST